MPHNDIPTFVIDDIVRELYRTGNSQRARQRLGALFTSYVKRQDRENAKFVMSIMRGMK